MVMPWAETVHAEPSNPARHPRFPVRATRLAAPAFPRSCRQSWGISSAQTAIIPTNSVIDANAAASSTNIFNTPGLLKWEHKKNIVPLLFRGVKLLQAWVG